MLTDAAKRSLLQLVRSNFSDNRGKKVSTQGGTKQHTREIVIVGIRKGSGISMEIRGKLGEVTVPKNAAAPALGERF